METKALADVLIDLSLIASILETGAEPVTDLEIDLLSEVGVHLDYDHRLEGTQYVATYCSLDVVSQGSTEHEALKMVMEAVLICIGDDIFHARDPISRQVQGCPHVEESDVN